MFMLHCLFDLQEASQASLCAEKGRRCWDGCGYMEGSGGTTHLLGPVLVYSTPLIDQQGRLTSEALCLRYTLPVKMLHHKVEMRKCCLISGSKTIAYCMFYVNVDSQLCVNKKKEWTWRSILKWLQWPRHTTGPGWKQTLERETDRLHDRQQVEFSEWLTGLLLMLSLWPKGPAGLEFHVCVSFLQDLDVHG